MIEYSAAKREEDEMIADLSVVKNEVSKEKEKGIQYELMYVFDRYCLIELILLLLVAVEYSPRDTIQYICLVIVIDMDDMNRMN